MHNTDYEAFYKKLDKHIKLTSIVTKNKYLPQLVKSCRLKPDFVLDRKPILRKASVVENWIDEFGNVFVSHDQSISYDKRANIVSSDLFLGRSLQRTIVDSRILLWKQNADVALCYGNDEYIRAFSDKQKLAPLSVGIETLEFLFRSLNTSVIRMWHNNIVMPLHTKQNIKACLPNWIISGIDG